jgi:glycosyltransferase involved in cell wall biosynthesis
VEAVISLLNSANAEWLAAFKSACHRSPRILHIGNIANNAYNNARLLNQAGFDCDVICYDYYHTMACPEWEDADFSAKFQNENFPDWWKLDLQGFQRPRWFAQGSFETCVQYLIAERTNSAESDVLWQRLSVQNGLLRKANSTSISRSIWIDRLTGFASKVRRLAATLIAGQLNEIPQKARSILKPRVPHFLFAPTLALLLIFFFLVRALGWSFKGVINRQSEATERHLLRVLEYWKEEFPDRSDVLLREDLLPYVSVLPVWSSLMDQYDFILGYSTDPLLPLLVEKPYFALEHGTIRDIPYSKSPIGRLCALSYRKAQHVFVTNFDCLKSAETLAPGRFTVINHPYDEDHGLSVTNALTLRSALLEELDSSFLVFHPTRHDWVLGTGYADKSNDVLIRAFIRLRKHGVKVGMICCNWGSNVKESKALLSDVGLDRYVKWIDPLPITPFERLCRACDLVADQFKLGAFGGVCFKAMAVGAPILTYLNELLLLRQFPEVPPVVNCSSTDDIVARLAEFVSNPERLRNFGDGSRHWMKTYHGKYATVNAQVDQFRCFFPGEAS